MRRIKNKSMENVKEEIKKYIFNWDLQKQGELWVPNHNTTSVNTDELSDEDDNFINIAEYEVLTTDEVDLIIGLMGKNNPKPMEKKAKKVLTDALWDNVMDIPEAFRTVKWINSKRVFYFGNLCILIPRCLMGEETREGRLCDFNVRLVNTAITYRQIELSSEENKDQLKKKFYKQLNQLKFRIANALFSKDFKKLYRMKFNGYTSVALTEFCDIDEIYIPEDYAKEHGLEIGDKCLMFRHPIQNLFVTVKIAGFTDSLIRMNSLLFTWLGGDHDGDKVEIVPLKLLIEENKKFFINGRTETLFEDADRLLPSRLVEDNELSKLIPGERVSQKHYMEKTVTMAELIEGSVKSKKYNNEVSAIDYLANQRGTILNMRTVKDGTGIAGYFCNNLMEVTDIAGGDMVSSRKICNDVQQAALDSKHDAATGKGYESTVWAQIAEVFNDNYGNKGLSEQALVDKLIKILDGKEKQIVKTKTNKKVSMKNRVKKESVL